jgi:hypothetical protein
VWEVRTHLLAAIHQLIDSGRPYVDANGEPDAGALLEGVKTIASRYLGAEWEGRELQSMLEAALGRRRAQQDADTARGRFKRAEWRTIRKLGGVR